MKFLESILTGLAAGAAALLAYKAAEKAVGKLSYKDEPMKIPSCKKEKTAEYWRGRLDQKTADKFAKIEKDAQKLREFYDKKIGEINVKAFPNK